MRQERSRAARAIKERNMGKHGNKNKKGPSLTTFILVAILLLGVALVAYPSVSNWWNEVRSTRAVTNYQEEVQEMDQNRHDMMLEAAHRYNAGLSRLYAARLSEEKKAEYEQLLNIGGNGIMGYIDIERINALLPIYHGTDEYVLQKGIGHVEWSSLPVGGEGTHCVLSGHRGLPSAKLFSDLDVLDIGDVFSLVVMDEVFSYEIDQIRIVEPKEVEELMITPGQDYCTLVTCTPYGVNSHRILARGHRVETEKQSRIRVVSDATRVSNIIVAPFVAIPLALLLFAADRVLTVRRRRDPRQ
jgi:sortase A